MVFNILLSLSFNFPFSFEGSQGIFFPYTECLDLTSFQRYFIALDCYWLDVEYFLWHCSLEDRSKCLLTSDGEPTTEQSKESNKVQLSEPMGLTEVTDRNRGVGLFTRVEMTQRPQKMFALAWMMTYETWSSVYNFLAVQQVAEYLFQTDQ